MKPTETPSSIEYGIISIPASPYLEEMRELLGCIFDVGVHVCGLKGSDVVRAFIMSGLATEFERANPIFVAGKSSYDTLELMLPYLGLDSVPDTTPRLSRTQDYWTGWIVSLLQSDTGVSYETIFEKIPYREFLGMYRPLHEAPEQKSIELMTGLLATRVAVTKLQKLRTEQRLSQRQLAELSSVNLRSIQMYEQRNKDINKAQASTLFRISTALNCSVEQLLER